MEEENNNNNNINNNYKAYLKIKNQKNFKKEAFMTPSNVENK